MGKTKARERIVVHLSLGLSMVLWAGAVVVAKSALREVSPLVLSALRSLVATAAIGAALLLQPKGQRSAIRRSDVPRMVVMGILGITLQYSLFYVALQHTTATNGALIFGMSPAFTAVLSALFLGESLHARRVLGLLAAFAGLGLLETRGSLAGLHVTPRLLGELMMLLTAVAWASYSVLGRPLFRRSPSLAVSFHVTWIGTLPLIPLAVWEGQRLGWGWPSPPAWLAIVYLGVLCSGVSYLVWNWALARIEASQVGVFVYVEPVITALLAWVFLSEALTWPVLVGGGLVLGGVALVGGG